MKPKVEISKEPIKTFVFDLGVLFENYRQKAPGIEETLTKLNKAGYDLILVSELPEGDIHSLKENNQQLFDLFKSISYDQDLRYHDQASMSDGFLAAVLYGNLAAVLTRDKLNENPKASAVYVSGNPLSVNAAAKNDIGYVCYLPSSYSFERQLGVFVTCGAMKRF